MGVEHLSGVSEAPLMEAELGELPATDRGLGDRIRLHPFSEEDDLRCGDRTKPLRQHRAGCDLRIDGFDVAALEEIPQAQLLMSPEEHFLITELGGESQDFGGSVDPLLKAVGTEHQEASTIERDGARRRIGQTIGHVDRLEDEPLPRLCRAVEVEVRSDRQSRQQTGAQYAVGSSDPLEGFHE